MKKTLSILAIALSCIAMSAAGQSHTVETVPNVQMQDARRFTSNPDGILSDGTVAEIDRMCMDLRQKKLAEVVVLVLNSVEPNSLDMFAHNVLNRWGVGWKGANNGLVISVVREQRDIQFATGYGLEGVLPDALCKRIQTVYMVTPLKDGDYNKGVLDGVRAVYNVLTGNTDELAALTAAHGERDATGKPMSFLSMIFFGALILLFLILALSRHSRGGGRGGRDRYDDYDGPSGGNSGGGGIGGSIIGGILGGMLGGGFGRGGGGFGGGGSFGGGFGGGMSGGGGSRSGF